MHELPTHMGGSGARPITVFAPECYYKNKGCSDVKNCVLARYSKPCPSTYIIKIPRQFFR